MSFTNNVSGNSNNFTMSKEEIEEHNKLCAKFLNVEFEIHSNTYRFKDYVSTKLLFHLDWNWIMEIIKSINKTQNPKQNIDTTHSTLKREIHRLLKTVNKEIVVKSIYSFLKFHFESKVITETK